MKKPFQILLRLAALKVALLTAPLALNAAVISLDPTLNGNIRSNDTGAFTGQSFITGDTGDPTVTNRYFNGMIAFTLPNLAGATINSVSLVFTSTGDGGTNSATPVTFQLYLSNRAFTNTATWTKYDGTNNWETAGGTGTADRGGLLSSITLNTQDYAGSTNVGDKLTLSSTTNFVDEVTSRLGGDLFLWFGLSPSDIDDNNRHVLNLASMRYSANTDYRPVLLIDYTPVPEASTTALLVLSGAMGLCAMRFRRRVSLTH